MRAHVVALMLCLLGFDSATRAGEDDVVMARANDFVAALKSASQGDLERCLSPSYFESISPEELQLWATRVPGSCGKITGFVLRRRPGPWRAAILLTTENGYRIPAFLEVEDKAPHLIHTAAVWTPVPHFESRAHLATAVARLGESAALFGAELTEDGLRPWIDIASTRCFSVASAMKLYLLCGVASDVAAGRRSWSDSITLRDADRSMGSGIMHRWPTGTGLSLQACAALMIGESDNTASDMILHALGRENMRELLSRFGHSNPEATLPYLSTAEWLALKYRQRGDLGREYLKLESGEREAYLRGKLASSSGKCEVSVAPRFVGEIGWLASARDLAEALRHVWVLSGKDPKGSALTILGIKASDLGTEGFFDYLGVKGGDDKGVRAWTAIVERDGRWDVLVCLVNDTKEDPSEDAINAVVWGILCRGEFELSD